MHFVIRYSSPRRIERMFSGETPGKFGVRTFYELVWCKGKDQLLLEGCLDN